MIYREARVITQGKLQNDSGKHIANTIKNVKVHN